VHVEHGMEGSKAGNRPPASTIWIHLSSFMHACFSFSYLSHPISCCHAYACTWHETACHLRAQNMSGMSEAFGLLPTTTLGPHSLPFQISIFSLSPSHQFLDAYMEH
jgi:hypothetical protein